MNLLSVFLISTKRLWNNKGLALCSILGLMVAVALISSVPLYADAANYRSLQEELAQAAGRDAESQPPFVFAYRYIGAWHGAIEIEDFEQANAYITQSVPGVVDLPLQST
jgi:putative ABC transport system permease protein